MIKLSISNFKRSPLNIFTTTPCTCVKPSAPWSHVDGTNQWRSEGGAGGASAPGRRPEGGAKIMTTIFF